MTIYALLGTYDCEGRYLIGIYSTKEKALEAAGDGALLVDPEDDYIIEEREIDAKASF